jgi:myo-inositol-1-phosphate synthase
MTHRRTGLWLIGAFGGVGSTVALGLAALRQKLTDCNSLVTALPLFRDCPLDDPSDFVLGGHDIRRTDYVREVQALHERANIFRSDWLKACRLILNEWSSNVRPGFAADSGAAIAALADWGEAAAPKPAADIIAQIQTDLLEFRDRNALEQMAVVHVASTEPAFPLETIHFSLTRLKTAVSGSQSVLPSSSLYAWAALDLGLPYVNFTPCLGASVPALLELALERKAVIAGQDGKTGETLLKSVLAPLFVARNWQVLSWVGHNVIGNRDGMILDHQENKSAKLQTKSKVIAEILGYQPQTPVSIEYCPSLDDWKTAWDLIHFRGFLDVKMSLQFTWQGCDSVLAAPLVLDLARLALLAQGRGEVGILPHLACFFKNPVGVVEHDFFKQFTLLEQYVRDLKNSPAVSN